MKEMFNLANALSVLRILLTPFFMYSLVQGNSWLAVALFSLAAVTDNLDGAAARRYGHVSSFGSFLDPIADKVMILGAFIAFYLQGFVPLWFVIILAGRDVFVTFLRVFLIQGGSSLKTSFLAKKKTFLQCVTIYVLFLHVGTQSYKSLYFLRATMSCVTPLAIYLVAFLTVYSAFDYVIKNKLFFKGKKGDHV